MIIDNFHARAAKARATAHAAASVVCERDVTTHLPNAMVMYDSHKYCEITCKVHPEVFWSGCPSRTKKYAKGRTKICGSCRDCGVVNA